MHTKIVNLRCPLGDSIFPRGIRIIFAFLGLVLANCSGNQPIYDGEINKDFLSFLESEVDPKSVFTIISNGGYAEDGYEAFKFISNNQVSIIVKIECISACAEDVLPGASNIVFEANPIIAYHWNSLMNRDQMLRHGGDVSYCSDNGINRQNEIYEYAGLNKEFWKEVEKRLNLTGYTVVPKPGRCPWKRRSFEHDFWLPTSDQLRRLLGLDFTGEVCADKFDSCSKSVDERWPKGTKVVIGNRSYVSNGW